MRCLVAALSSLLAAPALAATPPDRDVLPDGATPTAYAITLEPDVAAMTFKGEARLEFVVSRKTDRIVVNQLDLKIAEATLDGGPKARIETDQDRQRATFVFDAPLAKGSHRLDVAYTGKIYTQAYGLFAVKYPTPAGEETMLATQFEPGDARRLAPMWDEPGKKAVFNISAIVDPKLTVVSNAPILKSAPMGAKSKVDFAPTPKMSSYLLFFGAGHLDRITDTLGGVELGIVSRAGEGEKGRFAIDATKEILSAYNDYFGVPYPLAKLDQLAVPGAGGFGAMENWGAIMYFEQLLLLDPALSGPNDNQRIFDVIAHEVAHQWFGDLVTMAWWNDLWLNEGYASWMQAKISSKLHPERKAWLKSLDGKETAFALDAVASSHPIVQTVRDVDEANLAFDAITYQKGRAVIRMIEAYLGETAFRDGIRAYMKAHAYGNTTTDDLWSALEKTSKAPVRAIAADFTTQPGVPLIRVDGAKCQNGSTTLTLRQSNFTADVSGKHAAKRWRTPVTAQSAGASDVARAIVSGPEPQTLGLAGCGAVKVNVGESGYYRTHYPDTEFSALLADFDKLGEADQLGLINDAFALGKSGDAPLARFVDLVESTPADVDPVILSSIAKNLLALARLFDGTEGESEFKTFALGWLRGAFARTGWTAKDGESENAAILRGDLVQALAKFGDADVSREARKRFAAFRKDPTSLSAELVSPVLTAVGATADKKLLDAIIALARGATSPREARLYYLAAAGLQNPALAPAAAAAFLDPKTPSQLAPLLIRALSEANPKFGWDYYRANQAKIDALLDPLQRLRYPSRIARTSSDPAAAEKLEAFAKEKLPGSASADVARAAEAIRADQIVRQKRLPDLVKRLKTQPGT